MTLTIAQLIALLFCAFLAGGCFGVLIMAIFAGGREQPEPPFDRVKLVHTQD